MDQITKLLTDLATQLGVSVEYLWPHLVKYTMAQNIGYLIVDCIYLIATSVIVTLSIKAIRSGWGKDMGENGPSVAFWSVAYGALGIFVSFLITQTTLSNMPTHIAGAIAPEAQSILDLISKLSGKK